MQLFSAVHASCVEKKELKSHDCLNKYGRQEMGLLLPARHTAPHGLLRICENVSHMSTFHSLDNFLKQFSCQSNSTEVVPQAKSAPAPLTRSGESLLGGSKWLRRSKGEQQTKRPRCIRVRTLLINVDMYLDNYVISMISVVLTLDLVHSTLWTQD